MKPENKIYIVLPCYNEELVVGEYVAKIYTEVKRRPRYFVRDELK